MSIDIDKDERFAKGGRKYQVQRIWDLHHEIMRLSLLGWKAVAIADHLNVTPATVSNTLNSEICRRQMGVMQGARDSDTVDIMEDIKRLAPVALRTIESIMQEDPSGRNKLSAAIDILDRAGYAAPKVIEGRFTNVHLSADEVEEIKSRARQANVTVQIADSIEEGV